MASIRRNCEAGFYWVGIAMTLASLALILTGNSDLGWRFEHQGFPLSWAFAAAAILAFLATEHSPASSHPSEAEGNSPQFSPDFEVAEY
jgi:hypothetical protein